MKEARKLAPSLSLMALMALGLGGLIAMVISSSASGDDTTRDAARQQRTQQLFVMCANCHGDQGQGKQDLEAPTIAGLPRWYVQSQLEKFRKGIRGAHPDDFRGLQMRPMARQIYTDEDVQDLAFYVSQLPRASRTTTIQGDKAKGATYYFGTCSTCHGDMGQGMKALNAPPLVIQNDWYLVRQLENFKEGRRGYHAKDSGGMLMKSMVSKLPDSQAIRDVVAYLGTLGD